MKLAEIETAFALKQRHHELLYKIQLLENGRMEVRLDGEPLVDELAEAAKPGLRLKLAEELGTVISRLRALGVTID